MGINFFLPYKEPLSKGGEVVKDHKLIWKNYLTGWFPLDLVSIIPFDIMAEVRLRACMQVT